MNFSRQALLGIGMIVGGSVMLFAMVQQLGVNDKTADESVMIEKAAAQQAASAPLTTDIDTEKRILAQKQKERAARVAEQERRAQQFLIEQETAESQALAKSRTENQRYIENTTPAAADSASLATTESTVATPKVQPRVDTEANTVATATIAATNATKSKAQQVEQAAKEAEVKKKAEAKKRAEDAANKEADIKRKAEQQLATDKKAAKQKAKDEEKAAAEAKAAKQQAKDEEKAAADAKTKAPSSPLDYKVKSGDGLIKLAREYNVPVAVLAQANNTSTSASLQLGQTIVIPSRKQVKRLEREVAAAEKVRANEEAQAKKSAETKREA